MAEISLAALMKLVPWSVKISLGLPRLDTNHLKAARYASVVKSDTGSTFTVNDTKTHISFHQHRLMRVGVSGEQRPREIDPHSVEYRTQSGSLGRELSHELNVWPGCQPPANDAPATDGSHQLLAP